MEFTPWQVLEHRQAADDDGAGDDGDGDGDGDDDEDNGTLVVNVLRVLIDK